jgi:hypothetical protein
MTEKYGFNVIIVCLLRKLEMNGIETIGVSGGFYFIFPSCLLITAPSLPYLTP